MVTRSSKVAAEFEAGPYGAGALLYRVPDPQRFGVAEFDEDGNVVAFEEKPEQPKSDSIPIGVYFLRPGAFDVIERLTPSGRGEFEITDVLNHYIGEGGLYSAPLRGRLARRRHHRVAARCRGHGGRRRATPEHEHGSVTDPQDDALVITGSRGRLGRALLATAPGPVSGWDRPLLDLDDPASSRRAGRA